MGEEVDGQQLWSRLWFDILPVDAQAMLDTGVPLSYVRALYPLNGKNMGDQGYEVQFHLAALLAARVKASSTARRFESFFLGFCIDYKIETESIGRGRVEWKEGFKQLEAPRLLKMLTPVLDTGAANAYNQSLLPLLQLIKTLSWWLLCDDASLRESEPDLKTARYAAMFFDLLEVGDRYRAVMVD